MPFRLLPFFCSICLSAILVSVIVVAQSDHFPAMTQANRLSFVQEPHPGLPANLSRMTRGAPFNQRAAGAIDATAHRRTASSAPGLAFASAVTYGLGGSIGNFLTVADVNGDGKLDLLVANQCVGIGCASGGDLVGVLLGNGDGTFQPIMTYNAGGNHIWSVAVADVNGDGKLDLVAVSPCARSTCADGTVGVLLGNGDGTFRPVVTYDPRGAAQSVSILDLNGDGKPDLLVVNFDNSVGVLLGNGDGTFQPVILYGTGGYEAPSAVVADVNGDGKPDVVVANECVSGGNCAHGTVSVLLGNGDGTFQTAVAYASGGDTAMSVAVADVNGDGKPDLLVVNDNFYSGVPPGPAAMSTAGVLLGNGDGTFQAAVTYTTGGYYADSVAAADVNGDGKPDLLVANNADNSCAGNRGSVGDLLGNGDGTFQTSMSFCSGDYSANSVATGDVNGDGKPDLVVANDSTVGVLINTSVWPDFSMTPATTGLTLSPGGEETDVITIAPVKGTFGSTIQLSCAVSGPSPMPTCSLSATSVTPGSSFVTSTLTITAPRYAMLTRRVGRHPQLLYILWLPLATVGMIPILDMRKKWRPSMFCGFLLLIILLLVACGGSNSSHDITATESTNYTINVKGVSGATHHTTQVTVTVQ